MTTTHTVTIRETHVDDTYGRIFEGWMDADAQQFGALMHTHCAMDSSKAIAYCVEIEARAFKLGVTVERVVLPLV